MTADLVLDIEGAPPCVSSLESNSGNDGPFEPCPDGFVIAPRNSADANAANARRIEHERVWDGGRVRHGQPNAPNDREKQLVRESGCGSQ